MSDCNGIEIWVKGHPMVQLNGGLVDDADQVFDEHYFKETLGLKGEIWDSNGSEIDCISEVGNKYEAVIYIYEREFKKEDGSLVGFEEMEIKFSGTIENDKDEHPNDWSEYLVVENIQLVRVDGEYTKEK